MTNKLIKFSENTEPLVDIKIKKGEKTKITGGVCQNFKL